MEKLEKLYEGKAKILYTTADPTLLVQYFKDDATAFNAAKRGSIHNKGVLNNHITAILFRLLGEAGVPTHFVERLTDREMLVKRCQIIPLEVVVRNIIAGSMAKRFGKTEGEALPRPVVELYYKDDALGDPFINNEHVAVFGFATAAELATMTTLALRINDFLRDYFAKMGMLLVDFKLEFGRYTDVDGATTVLLADEITPDTCRLWDAKTREKLDKDRFRHDLGKVEEAYQRVYRAVCASVS